MAKSILKNPQQSQLENLDPSNLITLLDDSLHPERSFHKPAEQRRQEQQRIIHILLSERNLSRMKKSSCLALLARPRRDLLSENQQYALTHRLLTSMGKLSSGQLLDFIKVCPFDVERKRILEALYGRRETLSAPQLVLLMKLLFPKNPVKELRDVVGLLEKRSTENASVEAERERAMFGLTVRTGSGHEMKFPLSGTIHAHIFCNGCMTNSIRGTRYKCMSCADFDLCERCQRRVQQGERVGPHDHSHAVTIVQRPLQVFAGVPGTRGKFFLDVVFNQRQVTELASLQMQCVSSDRTPGHQDACLSILSAMPEGMGAKVYVSLPPHTARETVFVGALLPTSPFAGIEFARLLFPYWKLNQKPLEVSSIRLGISLAPLSQIEAKLKKSPALFISANLSGSSDNLISGSFGGASSASAAGSSAIGTMGATSSSLDGIYVCHGELQHFGVENNTTFGELLVKSARRWNLDPNCCELQDIEYATFPNDKLVRTVRNSRGNMPVVRLAQKKKATGFSVFSQDSWV